MPDYGTLKIIWWGLIGLLLIGFAIMDGHDMGVGTLLPWVAHDDVERRVVINTVGPHWDGNQVWLISAGGAMFAVWPLVYATALSGFYGAIQMMLWALFLRPAGFDFRSKLHNANWRKAWDWGLFAAGAVPPLIFGIAFGNLLQGMPFELDNYLRPHHSGSFWHLFSPFALLTGLVSSAMITLQGATFLAHRTEGAIQARTRRAQRGAALMLIVSFLAAGWWLRSGAIAGYQITSVIDPSGWSDPLTKTVVRDANAWWHNYQRWPLLWTLPMLVVTGAFVAPLLTWLRWTLCAFMASSLTVLGVIGTAGAAMFPFILPSSTMPNTSLTVWDSAASHWTLELVLSASLVCLPLVILYTGWAYRVMRGKVTAAHIQARTHSVY